MTAVDELKESDCGNATDETENDSEVEKQTILMMIRNNERKTK